MIVMMTMLIMTTVVMTTITTRMMMQMTLIVMIIDDVDDDSSCDSGGRVLISYRQLNDVPALERADKGLALLRLQAYASLLLVLYLRQQISSAAQMCVLCVFSLMHV